MAALRSEYAIRSRVRTPAVSRPAEPVEPANSVQLTESENDDANSLLTVEGNVELT